MSKKLLPIVGYTKWLERNKRLNASKSNLLLQYYSKEVSHLTLAYVHLTDLKKVEKQKKEFNAFKAWCIDKPTADLLEFTDIRLNEIIAEGLKKREK